MSNSAPLANGHFPNDARSAARIYIDRGMAPIPLPNRSKDPGIKGWQELRLTANDLDQQFPAGAIRNIGNLLGTPSGGLVDVDLDSPEAIAAAPYLLPPTGWVFGRMSKPRSHWEYTVRQPRKTTKFKEPVRAKPQADSGDSADEDKADKNNHKVMLLELRSTKSQTVFPPSLHEESGELIRWDEYDQPAEIDWSELLTACERVGAAALLARYWPAKGARHDARLALAGGLLRAGWPEDLTIRFITAVCVAAKNTDIADCEKVVSDTAARLRAGENVTGWPSLKQSVGDDVVTRVREWFGLRDKVPKLNLDTKRPQATKTAVRPLGPYQPFPTDALPGPARDFVREVAAATGTDEAMSGVPALAVMAGVIGNTRRLRPKHAWYESSCVWGLVIAESGTVKSAPCEMMVAPVNEIARRLFEEGQDAARQYREDLAEWKELPKAERGDQPVAPTQCQLLAEDTTIQALVELHADNPHGLVIYHDELDTWFNSFGLYQKNNRASEVPHWLKFHGGRSTRVNRKTGDRKHLYAPYTATSICGTIQPGTLKRSLTPDFFACGLAARILLAMPEKRKKVWSEADTTPDVESAYQQMIERLYGLEFTIGQNDRPAPVPLRLTPDARKRFIQFFGEWSDKQFNADADLAACFSKLEGYSLRFAMIHQCATQAAAGCDDPKDESPVTADSLEAGITLARWFAAEAERVYARLAQSNEQEEAQQLVSYIRGKGGSITVKTLQHNRGRTYPTSAAAEEALDALAQAGLGTLEDSRSGPEGGRPSKIFTLAPPPTADDTDETCPGGGGRSDQLAAGPTDDTHPADDETYPGSARNGVSSVSSVVGGETNGIDGDLSTVEQQPTEEEVLSASSKDGNGPSRTHCREVITKPDDLMMAATAVEESVRIGLDIETTGLNPRIDRARLLTLATDRGTYLIDLFELASSDLTPVWEVLRGKPILGHNLAFDLGFLARLGFAPGEVRDTMLMSQVLYSGERVQGHKLADCTFRELSLTLKKDEQKGDWSKSLSTEQIEYAATDAEVLLPLFTALNAKLAAAELREAADVEHRALPGLVWLGGSGVGFDGQRWDGLAADAQAESVALAGELDALAARPDRPGLFGGGWNWDSPDQVKLAFAALGFQLDSTDDNALAAVSHPLADKLRDYRGATKRCSTYGKDWSKFLAADGRVYAAWRQLGADSGRMACSKPNLQNLPRDARYRQCFHAPPGRVLVKADYSQIELRIAAKVSGDKRMLSAYQSGEDLHTLTARQILGKAEVSKGDRQLAKAVNFGLLYGMGAKAFRVYAKTKYGVDLTEAQAAAYRRTFFRTYPGLRKWHGSMPDAAVDTRTLTGRRRIGV
ncbi:MAG: DNA polymerase, partial [Gemmataceae bacterium]